MKEKNNYLYFDLSMSTGVATSYWFLRVRWEGGPKNENPGWGGKGPKNKTPG